MDDLFTSIDLDADRARRAAEREAKGSPSGGVPIILGGETVATLPVEVPVDVFAPIRGLDQELALIIDRSVKAARGETSQQATTDLVIDLLITNPSLPSNAIDIATQITVNLIGQEGLDALMAHRPSGQDVAVLVKGVFRFYGLSLGESLPSSDSSTGGGTDENAGETSNGTSSTTSDSTSEESTDVPETTASSAPAVS